MMYNYTVLLYHNTTLHYCKTIQMYCNATFIYFNTKLLTILALVFVPRSFGIYYYLKNELSCLNTLVVSCVFKPLTEEETTSA